MYIMKSIVVVAIVCLTYGAILAEGLECYECIFGRLVPISSDAVDGGNVNVTEGSNSRIGVDDTCAIGETPRSRYAKSCPGNRCLRLEVDSKYGNVANGLVVIRGCMQNGPQKECENKSLDELYNSALGETKAAIDEARKMVTGSSYTANACFCDSDKCNPATQLTLFSYLHIIMVLCPLFYLLSS